MRVRLKDIAKDLNLSKMTISKVLRGQMDISDETKARVLKRVKELNYIPNVSASSLRTGQTKTIGLVLPSVGARYLADVTSAIGSAVKSQGYSLIVSVSEGDLDIEQKQIAVLLSLQVDALLLVSLQETALFFEQLKTTKEFPVIFIVSQPLGAPGRFIGIHEEEVGRIACEHLIECGCKRIAYIRGPHSAIGDRRSNGYRQALRERVVPIQPRLVIETMSAEGSEYEYGYQAMEKLLCRRGRPDGVMTYSDLLAVGAMDAANRHGLRIPEDVRFVGCGDDPLLCAMRVPLTSMNLSGCELGDGAGKLALRAIASRNRYGARNLMVKPKLVKRRSSAISN
jgi:LacI family transcriptional regulator, galactose operon repressor